jgi:hypothetical protein
LGSRVVSWAGAKANEQYEVAWALGSMSRCWQRCQCQTRTQQVSRFALSRGREDGCPRRDRVHQRKGFRDHGSPSSRHESPAAMSVMVRSPNKRDEASDRPSNLGPVRPGRLQDRAQRVSRSRLRGFASIAQRLASAVRGRSADTRLRGMPVFEVRQLIPHRMGWPRPSPSL